MGVVERFKRKLAQLKAVIPASIKESIDRNKDVLTNQQQDQFNKGEDSKGMQFVPSYALSTIKKKRSKGQPTNRVTLKDTGDLYRSIEVETTTNEAIIKVNVEYFKYLVGKYDQNIILGMQEEFLKEFMLEYTLPILKQNFKAIIRQ